MTDAAPKSDFQFVAGRLCLDFANTVDYRNSPQELDQLNTYEDVIAWAEQAGIVSEADARKMKQAAKNGMRAETALRHALTLREAIYEIVSAAVNREPWPEMPVHFLNRTLRDAGGQRILAAGKDRFTWKWNRFCGRSRRMRRSYSPRMNYPECTSVRLKTVAGCSWIAARTRAVAGAR